MLTPPCAHTEILHMYKTVQTMIVGYMLAVWNKTVRWRQNELHGRRTERTQFGMKSTLKDWGIKRDWGRSRFKSTKAVVLQNTKTSAVTFTLAFWVSFQVFIWTSAFVFPLVLSFVKSLEPNHQDSSSTMMDSDLSSLDYGFVYLPAH